MKVSLFITGSSGYIAGNLLKRLNLGDYKNICCLSRSESSITASYSRHDNFTFLKGSIYDADMYTSYLSAADTVVHFAAATGKVTPADYFRVNAEGTAFLIKQCEQSGVKNFLYISSIAVKYPDISSYFYAQSKKQGEDAVRNSSLNYTIIRPTIVIGRDSSIWNSLLKLAGLFVIPVFGDGRSKIQPVHVDDLTDCISDVMREELFQNESFDLGGPEIITMEDFLKKIHRIIHKKDPGTIHIPLRLLIPFLSILEKFMYSFLPFTTGQLSPFRFDSTIEENRLFLKYFSGMKNLDKMLELVIGNE